MSILGCDYFARLEGRDNGPDLLYSFFHGLTIKLLSDLSLLLAVQVCVVPLDSSSMFSVSRNLNNTAYVLFLSIPQAKRVCGTKCKFDAY